MIYHARIRKLRKTTLRKVADGQSLGDINRAICGMSADLLRARLDEPANGLSYEAKNLLVDTVNHLVSIRKRTACSGMDTVLTDTEARLLTDLAYDKQATKVDRLADLIGDTCDLRVLLNRILDQIEFNMEDAEDFDRQWWECGVDEGVIADYERLDAIKLLLLRNKIFKAGTNVLLSADSADLINRILSSSNTLLRRLEVQRRAIGLGDYYAYRHFYGDCAETIGKTLKPERCSIFE